MWLMYSVILIHCINDDTSYTVESRDTPDECWQAHNTHTHTHTLVEVTVYTLTASLFLEGKDGHTHKQVKQEWWTWLPSSPLLRTERRRRRKRGRRRGWGEGGGGGGGGRCDSTSDWCTALAHTKGAYREDGLQLPILWINIRAISQ